MFIKVKGTPNKPESFSVDVKGFHIMDVGTQGYTNFDYTEDLIDIYEANPEYMECRMGMLHSHNSMDTFFSGTDMEELEDNTTDTDFMVSLIVNNASDYTAKVAWRTIEQVDIKTTGWFGKIPLISNSKREIESLYTVDLDIEIVGEDKLTIIDSRIAEIVKVKELAAKAKAATAYENTNFNWETKPKFKDGWSDIPQTSMFNDIQEVNNFHQSGVYEETPIPEDIPVLEGHVFDNFLACLVLQRMAYEGSFLNAMREVKAKVKSNDTPILVDLIIDNLEDFYENHYGAVCTMNAYLGICGALNKALRKYDSIDYPLVTPLMSALDVELGEPSTF